MKTAGSGVRYFGFPKDTHYRDLWVNMCRRPNDVNVKNAVVCSAHFTKNDYIDDMKSRLLGIESPRSKRILKEEAVPSLFLHSGKSTQLLLNDNFEANVWCLSVLSIWEKPNIT